jgi:hypothetical protein
VKGRDHHPHAAMPMHACAATLCCGVLGEGGKRRTGLQAHAVRHQRRPCNAVTIRVCEEKKSEKDEKQEDERSTLGNAPPANDESSDLS